MSHFIRALALASALAVAGPVQGQELLRWGFQAGDTLEYRMTEKQSTSGEMMGQSISQSGVQTWTLEAAVRQVEANGNATVDWTYTRVQMSTEGDGMSFDWDSDRPDPSVTDTPLDSMVASLEAMIGLTLTVVITPLGEILEVRGADAMLDAMLGELDPSNAPMMEEQFQTMFGEEWIGSSFMGGLGTFPEAPVGSGGSWTTRSETSVPFMGGSMALETRNTVTGFENRSGERVALILHEGTIELDSSGEGFMGLPISFALDDASHSGSTAFSIDRGLILSSTSRTEFVMSISMPDAGIRQQMQVEGSTILELVGPVERR